MKHRPLYRKLVWGVVGLLVVLGVWVALAAADPKPEEAPSFPRDHLTIETRDGQKVPYETEVATTTDQERYGLMFRKFLPADQGMIFIYDPPLVVQMWMKNTFIPLDMLFVREDGVIVKMITHAVPFDLTPLSSDEPVKAVIELNAGEVMKHGLKTGDRVKFSAFSD
jgi:uncharacterized membrane protein (UPF0127 family)